MGPLTSRCPQQCPGIHYVSSLYEYSAETGEVVFTGGSTFDTVSQELCYLGSETTSTPVDVVEDFDCEAYNETAPSTDGYPFLVIDTMKIKTWNLGNSITGGLSCPVQLVSWYHLAEYAEFVWHDLAVVLVYSFVDTFPWSMFSLRHASALLSVVMLPAIPHRPLRQLRAFGPSRYIPGFLRLASVLLSVRCPS